MKKTRHIIFAVILILTVAVTCTIVYAVRSPEYALIKILKDIEKSGADGLYPHLTGEAQEAFDKAASITDNKIFNSIMSFFNAEDYIRVLKSKLQETKWGLTDILKSKNRASVILSFNYKDKMAGTIEVNMIKDNGEWKICEFKFPKFDVIDF